MGVPRKEQESRLWMGRSGVPPEERGLGVPAGRERRQRGRGDNGSWAWVVSVGNADGRGGGGGGDGGGEDGDQVSRCRGGC